MSSILDAAPPAHFLAGLALLTMAAMTCAALRRAATRPSAAWGLSALIALAVAEWCDLALGGSTRPIWQWARLALEAVGLTGLVELGRRCATTARSGLLPRWSYPLVASLALAAVLLDMVNPLEFALRLAILWQAGWLAAVYFTRGQDLTAESTGAMIPSIGPGALVGRVMIGGLLVYLVAASVAIPLLGMLAALVAATAAFLAFGPTAEQNRPTRLIWRSAWPVGFVLIAAAGCLALRSGPTETDLLLVAVSEPADSRAADDLTDADSSSDEADDPRDEMSAADDQAAATSQLAKQAKRYGLGISPIILFVLFVWGLSRLPFVH